ncbi:DUF6318 family protein [Paenarthrobacter nitroguajacolicus]|uniref:DUF6318 family protein n=1 Tax=Paenarthrobacter nitroguajacolicus TaxID=211146 RepID=UPI004054280C
MSRLSFASFPSFRVRTAVFCLATAVLLSGCQGSSAGTGSPSETSSTTASPASSVSAPAASATPAAPAVYKPADANGKAQNVPVPVMPELAKENSKAGLEAFIRYWYATYSYAIETGDLASWKAVTDTTVPAAVAHEKSVNLNYINGRWLAGGRLTVPAIEVVWSPSESTTHSTKVQVIQEAIQYFDADGTNGQKDSTATNTADAVFTNYIGGDWKVTDYGTIVG